MTAASANTPLLAIEALEVAYHRTAVALHGISLKVMPQTIVAVLGNNGAGKTTTLRAISGFIGIDDARVTGGRIAFAGKRIENQSPHANTARGIVLVPERDKVFPNLTVAENLIVAASHRANAAEQSGGHRRLYRHAAGRLMVRFRQRSAYCAVRLATAAKTL
ncbi:MAG TPA: ATP-binding cassette domain-containing protein [Xanthobacteraceae bacterium]